MSALLLPLFLTAPQPDHVPTSKHRRDGAKKQSEGGEEHGEDKMNSEERGSFLSGTGKLLEKKVPWSREQIEHRLHDPERSVLEREGAALHDSEPVLAHQRLEQRWGEMVKMTREVPVNPIYSCEAGYETSDVRDLDQKPPIRPQHAVRRSEVAGGVRCVLKDV